MTPMIPLKPTEHLKPLGASERGDADMTDERAPDVAEALPDDASGAISQQTPADAVQSQTGLSERIAALEAELNKERDAATDYMQRWQRAQADYSNFSRR